MTPDEYRSVLTEIGLPQTGAARLFLVNETTSKRWAGATARPCPVPPDVALALRMMQRHGVDPRSLEPAPALVQVLRMMARQGVTPDAALSMMS